MPRSCLVMCSTWSMHGLLLRLMSCTLHLSATKAARMQLCKAWLANPSATPAASAQLRRNPQASLSRLPRICRVLSMCTPQGTSRTWGRRWHARQHKAYAMPEQPLQPNEWLLCSSGHICRLTPTMPGPATATGIPFGRCSTNQPSPNCQACSCASILAGPGAHNPAAVVACCLHYKTCSYQSA